MFRKLAVVFVTALGLIATPQVAQASNSTQPAPQAVQLAPSQMEMVFAAEDFTVYKGFQAVSKVNISVTGSGAWVSGKIAAKVSTCEYKALYEVYRLSKSEAAGVWFAKYRQEKRYDELKLVFEDSKKSAIDVNFDFRLQGNDRGITSVTMGFTVIRIDYQGQTKYFTVLNSASGEAQTPTGDSYPGGFELIG